MCSTLLIFPPYYAHQSLFLPFNCNSVPVIQVFPIPFSPVTTALFFTSTRSSFSDSTYEWHLEVILPVPDLFCLTKCSAFPYLLPLDILMSLFIIHKKVVICLALNESPFCSKIIKRYFNLGRETR